MSDNATLDELEAEDRARKEARASGQAQRDPGRRGGRGRRTTDPNSRRYRADLHQSAAPGPDAAPAQPGITQEQLDAMLDASLEELADLPVLLWKLAPPCNPDEKRQFRAATKPVLLKHMGELLTNFGVEITCIITLYAIYQPRVAAKRDRESQAASGGAGERQNAPGQATVTQLRPPVSS